MTPEELAAKIKSIIGSKRRAFIGSSVKGIDADKRQIRAYASTNDWDRYGEKFEADAFREGLADYQKNPVILFAHDYGSAPIGKAVGYEFDTRGLILTMEFAQTEKAEEIFQLYLGGFMNAFSVGFKPTEVAYEERTPGGEMGLVYKKAMLLENSAVPVPANPGAVVIKGAGQSEKTITGEALSEILIRSFRGDAFAIETPIETKAAETSTRAEGHAPNLKDSLEYLIGLCKITRAKGKVTDEGLKALLMQVNNLCRELVLGPGAASLESPDGEMSAAQMSAFVKEYELLSEAVMNGAVLGEDEMKQFEKFGEIVDKIIAAH